MITITVSLFLMIIFFVLLVTNPFDFDKCDEFSFLLLLPVIACVVLMIGSIELKHSYEEYDKVYTLTQFEDGQYYQIHGDEIVLLCIDENLVKVKSFPTSKTSFVKPSSSNCSEIMLKPSLSNDSTAYVYIEGEKLKNPQFFSFIEERNKIKKVTICIPEQTN